MLIYKRNYKKILKINRSQTFANTNMRKNGNTKNRPEQILAKNIIENHLPKYANVRTEEDVICFNPDNPETPKEISVDITVRLEQLKVSIEMQGGYHNRKNVGRRDFRKGITLEWKGNDWKHIVFVDEEMPGLWLRNKRELNDQELEIAYNEIKQKLSSVLQLSDWNIKCAKKLNN